MKKIVYRIASLTLAASILGACSNKEEATTKNEDTKQETKAETTQSTSISNGVQFVYNGKEVTDKELKDHEKEYLNWVDKKYINPAFLAKNYVLTHEFFKYLNVSEEDFEKDYEKHVSDSKTDGLEPMKKGEYLMQFISFKLVDKELDESELKSLYDGMSSEDKKKLAYSSFKSNKYLVYKSAVKEKVIVPHEVQDKVMEKAEISNKKLNFDHKLTDDSYMPLN